MPTTTTVADTPAYTQTRTVEDNGSVSLTTTFKPGFEPVDASPSDRLNAIEDAIAAATGFADLKAKLAKAKKV